MYQAKFQCQPTEDPLGKLSLLYPECSFSVHSATLFNATVRGVLFVSGYKDYGALLCALQRVDGNVCLLEKNESSSYFWFDVPFLFSLFDAVAKNKCFCLECPVYVNGEVTFTLCSHQTQHLQNFHAASQQYRLVFLKKYTFFSEVTARQTEVFTLARNLGYYDRPRKISATELAKRYRMKKSSFIETLRRAEGNILRRWK